MSRWIARICDVLDQTVHYERAPPGLFDGPERVPMPEAAWVQLEVNKDGVFLIRYSESGEFAGDTWTPTRELALTVAAEEYGLAQDDWVEVPDSIVDPIAFARSGLQNGN